MRLTVGTQWGESGYIRMAMEDDGPGVCGMYQVRYIMTPFQLFMSWAV